MHSLIGTWVWNTLGHQFGTPMLTMHASTPRSHVGSSFTICYRWSYQYTQEYMMTSSSLWHGGGRAFDFVFSPWWKQNPSWVATEPWKELPSSQLHSNNVDQVVTHHFSPTSSSLLNSTSWTVTLGYQRRWSSLRVKNRSVQVDFVSWALSASCSG